jgi:hypothetical protein
VSDWLDEDDWLSVTDSGEIADEEKPADTSLPGIGALMLVAEAQERKAKFISAWSGLTDKQRVWLNTWRECRFNANKAIRVLANTGHAVSKTLQQNWQEKESYAYVRDLLRQASVEEILNRDHLALRHDDIVETLLTPQPILHQGIATGHYEVQAGAAGKANEVLLRLGGHLKEREDINIGMIGPSLVIQVVQPSGNIIDVTPQHVRVDLPAPAGEV